MFVSRGEGPLLFTMYLSGWLQIASEKTLGPSYMDSEQKLSSPFKGYTFVYLFICIALLPFQDCFPKALLFSFICLLTVSVRQADTVTVCSTVSWSFW